MVYQVNIIILKIVTFNNWLIQRLHVLVQAEKLDMITCLNVVKS